MTLVEFLRACLDEEEAVANRDPDAWRRLCLTAYENLTSDTTVTMGEVDAILTWTMPDPRRALAEVAAKRAIVDLHPIPCLSCAVGVPDPDEYGDLPCPTLLYLAQPYAEHVGWDEAWRVDA